MGETVYVGVLTADYGVRTETIILGASKNYAKVLAMVRDRMKQEGFDISEDVMRDYEYRNYCFMIKISGLIDDETLTFQIWASNLE